MPDDQRAATAGAKTTEDDEELIAINSVVAALKPLHDEQRSRVIEYVLGRFGSVRIAPPFAAVRGDAVSVVPAASGDVLQNIRSLKDAKNPKSANEMAALVAYYVSELAPAAERKLDISKADIEKYFKNGGFHLPADASFTLVNAKNAGYLDSIGGGKYKLNPVGYNLVAHRMGGGKAGRDKKGRTRKDSQKSKRAANRKR